MQGSNLRPLACKASALPAELILQQIKLCKNGDPYGIRTRVTAVKGRCLNRLTKGPLSFSFIWLCTQLNLAEKEGFEPSRRLPRPMPLAGAPLQPLEYFPI